MLKLLDLILQQKVSSKLNIKKELTLTGHMQLQVVIKTTIIDKTRVLTGSSTIGIKMNKLKVFIKIF